MTAPPPMRPPDHCIRPLLLAIALAGLVALTPVAAQSGPGDAGGAQTGSGDTPPRIAISYYGEIGCSHCDAFMDVTVPRMETTYGVALAVDAKDILDADVYAECSERLAAVDRPFRTYPVLFIGNNSYQGRPAVEEGLTAELDYYVGHGSFLPRVPQSMDGSDDPGGGIDAAVSLKLLPVLFAGLADGINPCAFATMIFLLSLLALVGRSRRQILAVGLIYALAVFLTYLALGFGLLGVLRASMNVSALRLALRILVSAASAVFALLSIRDAVLLRSGRSSEAVLQLSLKSKQRIHGVIRRGVRTGGLILGTAGLAFLVSLLELACTGQLYLPTIAYLVQTGSTRAVEVAALIGYNIAFILPLLVLLAVVYSGVGSQRVARWFERRAVAAKLGMGAVFLLLAVAVWLV